MNPQLHEHLAWLISRAAALTALTLLALVVLLGLLTASGLWGRLGRPGWKSQVLGWHAPLAWTAVGCVVLHVAALYWDPWLHPGLRGILLPLTLTRLPGAGWVQLGWLGIGGLLAAVGAFYGRRRLRGLPGRWQGLHRLGSAGIVLIVLHGLGAGPELAAPGARWALGAGGGLLLAGLLVRLTVRRSSNPAVR